MDRSQKHCASGKKPVTKDKNTIIPSIYDILTNDKTLGSIICNATYRSDAISIIIPIRFFAEIGNSVLKFKWNLKGL